MADHLNHSRRTVKIHLGRVAYDIAFAMARPGQHLGQSPAQPSLLDFRFNLYHGILASGDEIC